MDRGFQYGDGLFETIVYEEGRLQFWDEHISRMQKGADQLGIAFPGDENYLQDIKKTTTINPDTKSVIKLLLTRGQGRRGYPPPRSAHSTRAVIRSDHPVYPPELAINGINVCLCKHPVSSNPVLAGIKHLNRLDNVLASSEWGDEFHEGFMFDINGYLIEGTMSNIFCIKNETLLTPGLDHCGVNGIIRDQILSIAKQKEIACQIKNITIDELFLMDEVFITNSIIGLWPVRCVGETRYPTDNITRAFESELRQRVKASEKTIT